MYGMVARRHMHEFGTTSEQLASVAGHCALPRVPEPGGAQMRTLITVEDVARLQNSSPTPLHLLDCCLISDAAGRDHRPPPPHGCAATLAPRPVYVRGVAEFHTHEHVTMARQPHLVRCRGLQPRGLPDGRCGTGRVRPSPCCTTASPSSRSWRWRNSVSRPGARPAASSPTATLA